MKTTNLFKRIMFIIVVALAASTVNAQEKGDMAAGVNLAYGTKSGYSNFGIGAKFQYNIFDKIRIEPSATYFLEKDYVSMWDINANAHYLFGINEKFCIYPLAGLAVLGVSYDWGDLGGLGVKASNSSTSFGINLGAGGEYLITEKIALSLELKYQIVSDWNRLILSIGAIYRF